MRKGLRQDNPDEAIVLTEATIRAAERLDLSQNALASIIGLSAATISRIRKGTFVLDRASGKAFELAQMLVQLYDALDRIVAGDGTTARLWLVADNSALGGRPIELIQNVRGLVAVVGYLRARSSSNSSPEKRRSAMTIVEPLLYSSRS